jgi:hypothetical protein
MNDSEDSGAPTEKQQLKPASENPWYVLATIYGEQGEEFDEVLHARNRRIWNGWACTNLTLDERAALAKKVGVEARELDSWTEGLWSEMIEILRKRIGADFVIPYAESICDFSSTRFEKPIYMAGFVFICPITFRAASFCGDASFRSASFSHVADFERTSFCGSADFVEASFSGYANFGDSSFCNDARFMIASFSGNANFQSALFQGSANFLRSTFHRLANFTDSKFKGAANFTDAHFHQTTRFRDSSFAKHYPVLSGAILHANTIFTAKDSVEREEDGKKKNIRLWPSTKAADPEPSRESVAIIRHAVAKQGTPEDEHFFFRREMAFRARMGGRFEWPSWTSPFKKPLRCPFDAIAWIWQRVPYRASIEEGCRRFRSAVSGFFQRLPYQMFGLVSEFGYSIQRPVYSLLALFVIFGAIFAAASYGGGWHVDSPKPWVQCLVAPFGLSFANIFAFFGFHRLYEPGLLSGAPWWMLVLSGVQTVLGFILLFFLGLGLRTRFRLR